MLGEDCAEQQTGSNAHPRAPCSLPLGLQDSRLEVCSRMDEGKQPRFKDGNKISLIPSTSIVNVRVCDEKGETSQDGEHRVIGCAKGDKRGNLQRTDLT